MINRINLILRAKNITARQFAEEIGIQPSGMSHILGGRNNPSLDFAVKVLRRYPEIDANWLLMGKGAMYGNGTVEPVRDPMPQFSFGEEEPVRVPEPVQSEERRAESEEWSAEGEAPRREIEHLEEKRYYSEERREEGEERILDEKTFCESMPKDEDVLVSPGASIEDGVKKVVLIYGDNTYEVLRPRR